MEKTSKRAGISLVALIVTIIVLIILTAAVIVTFMEGGIIEKAKEAVFKSDIRTYQEILAVKNAEKQIELATGNGEGVQLNATELAEIQEIIPEFKEEYKDLIAISNGEIVLGSLEKEPYSGWLADLGIELSSEAKKSITTNLKVGDYVDYNIAGGTYRITEEERSWVFNDLDKGSHESRTIDFDEGEDIIEYQDINWRVLKNDGSVVTLITADPVYNICLYGKKGFFEGLNKLDEICQIVYGGRNLKIEDVNEVLKVNVGEDVNPSYMEAIDYTRIEMEAGATFGDAIDHYGYDVSQYPESVNNYRDYELSYSYNKSIVTKATEIEKEIVFIDNEYWLSSACIDVCFHDDAYFCLRSVNANYVMGQYWLYRPSSLENLQEFALVFGLRPVVTLSSSTQIADVTGDGSSASSPWQLK
ncbi:MAG: hypothetical protein E7311_02010 [Clostridiales bacterium]|nr:hypothetical protein [Clostridiales bacterium]